jgi:phosphate-selective porin
MSRTVRSPSLTLAITIAVARTALAAEVPAPEPAAPLAGFSDGTAFLRSADDAFQLFPSGRLQIDGYFFHSANKTPFPGFLDRRARLETAGWVGGRIYFQIGGDFAAGPNAALANLNATDDFVALAPWADLAILQVGQFDAPFTLENRTSDKYFDFMERSAVVRTFAAPSNKEQGLMVHGLLPKKLAYYSVGVFDGDGQNMRNLDGSFDLIGRGWIAPFALLGPEWLGAVTVGGSGWSGRRASPLTQTLAGQSTQGGFAFWSPKWTGPPAAMGAAAPSFELRPNGHLGEWALEVNAPVGHRLGARLEWVKKDQRIATVATGGTPALVAGGGGTLEGWGIYGEVWGWVLGDDRIIGAPGLQLPHRYIRFGTKPPTHGLMLAARLEELCEGVEADSTDHPLLGNTRLTALTVGANYWYSKRFRATFNYVRNHLSGDTAAVQKLTSRTEQEFLLRLAVAL